MYIPGHYAFVLFALLLAQSSVIFIYTMIGLLKSSPVPLFDPIYPPPPPNFYHQPNRSPIDRGIPVRDGDDLGDTNHITVTATQTVYMTAFALSPEMGPAVLSGPATSIETSVATTKEVSTSPPTTIQTTLDPSSATSSSTQTSPTSTAAAINSRSDSSATTAAVASSGSSLAPSSTDAQDSTTPITSRTTPSPVSTACVKLVMAVSSDSTGFVTRPVPITSLGCIATPTATA